MALLSQGKALAGSKAFHGLRTKQAPVVSNGSSRVTMKRRDSYVVEVNVGEDEPEDIAVRRFMKKVVESGVVEELRNRRYKETPLEEWKRRTRERIAKNKAGIRLPTWEEEYGPPVEVRPFDEFFQRDPENTANFVDGFLNYTIDSDGGGYVNDAAWGAPAMGGYMGSYMPADQAGGYMTTPDAGMYGGYAPPATDIYGQPVYADPAMYTQDQYSLQPPPQGGYQ